MKPLIVSASLLGLGLLSQTPPRPVVSADNPAVRSERDYAVQSEARAQDLYKTGQAGSLQEARAQAGAEANQQWYAAAKAKERRKDQEKFEKDFKKSQASTP